MQQRTWLKRALLALAGLVLMAIGFAGGLVPGLLLSVASLGGANMAKSDEYAVAQAACDRLRDIRRAGLTVAQSVSSPADKDSVLQIVRSSVEGLTLCREKDVITDSYEEIGLPK